MSERKLISLGVLAKKLNVAKSKLDYYNKIGLIYPKYVTEDNSVRIYDKEEVVKRIKFIQECQKNGQSLKTIKEQIKK